MSSNDLRTFLRNLWQQGVELWLDGDQLRFRGDKAVMSGDTLSRLRANKEALIAIIRENPLDYTGFPLSHGQRSIHLMQRLAPDSFAYNQACLLRLADAACYAAKNKGRNSVHVADAQQRITDTGLLRRLAIGD